MARLWRLITSHVWIVVRTTESQGFQSVSDSVAKKLVCEATWLFWRAGSLILKAFWNQILIWKPCMIHANALYWAGSAEFNWFWTQLWEESLSPSTSNKPEAFPIETPNYPTVSSNSASAVSSTFYFTSNFSSNIFLSPHQNLFL
jgi:hypothetical protein